MKFQLVFFFFSTKFNVGNLTCDIETAFFSIMEVNVFRKYKLKHFYVNAFEILENKKGIELRTLALCGIIAELNKTHALHEVSKPMKEIFTSAHSCNQQAKILISWFW